jgi:hypothetical protein
MGAKLMVLTQADLELLKQLKAAIKAAGAAFV